MLLARRNHNEVLKFNYLTNLTFFTAEEMEWKGARIAVPKIDYTNVAFIWHNCPLCSMFID